MRWRRFKILVFVVGLIGGLAGCQHYLKCPGDWYGTTRKLWKGRFVESDRIFPQPNSLGQTIADSGLLLFGFGYYVTAPVGLVIYGVEHVTLAPAWDTVVFPIDLCCRPLYLNGIGKQEKEREERRLEQQRMQELCEKLEKERNAREGLNDGFPSEKTTP